MAISSREGLYSVINFLRHGVRASCKFWFGSIESTFCSLALWWLCGNVLSEGQIFHKFIMSTSVKERFTTTFSQKRTFYRSKPSLELEYVLLLQLKCIYYCRGKHIMYIQSNFVYTKFTYSCLHSNFPTHNKGWRFLLPCMFGLCLSLSSQRKWTAFLWDPLFIDFLWHNGMK